jgi:GntR family transcriptional regulator
MRLWLSKSSEVPIREQLVSQVVLGIVSNDLKSGERLPSTRELARRYKIHANTVSAAYRDLARRGWVEFRKGSGVYVREFEDNRTLDADFELDQLIALLLQKSRKLGFSLNEIQNRVKHWLEIQPPDRFLVIEPDDELRRILITEIKEATAFRVVGIGIDNALDAKLLTGAACVALYDEAENVRVLLPPNTNVLLLRLRSVTESIQGKQKPSQDELITVISRCQEFLRMSRTVLIAAGVEPDALSLRDARKKGWQKGLRSSSFVITDAVTAKQMPDDLDLREFRIIADSSIDELKKFIEQFLSDK